MFVKYRAAIVKVATAVAILLAVAVALLGLFLAIVGTSWMLVEQFVTPEGTSTVESTARYPTQHGLFGALAAVMMIVGLLMGKLRIAWYGIAFLFAYSVLFLFSVGAALLPVDFILLILLIIIQLIKSKH